jgi:hypothetical protein
MTDAEQAFANWPHSHRPNEYFLQKRAFEAGWDACMEKFREMDLTLAELEAEVRQLKAKHGEAN